MKPTTQVPTLCKPRGPPCQSLWFLFEVWHTTRTNSPSKPRWFFSRNWISNGINSLRLHLLYHQNFGMVYKSTVHLLKLDTCLIDNYSANMYLRDLLPHLYVVQLMIMHTTWQFSILCSCDAFTCISTLHLGPPHIILRKRRCPIWVNIL